MKNKADITIFSIPQGTDKQQKIEKNIVTQKDFNMEMDTFYEINEGFNINRNKLLNMKIAPMFLDNKITLCLQVNDVTKSNIINNMKSSYFQQTQVL